MIDYVDSDAVDFGSLGYGGEEIAAVLGCSVADVGELMAGDFGLLYKKGEARFRFEMDKKLMQMALGGDLKALAEIEKRKRKMKS